MKIHDNEILDLILKVLGAVGILFIVHRVSKIYKGADGKFSEVEFGRFAGIIFFLWAGWYVVTKEGNRPSETQHIFSEMWLALIFSALLTVLHLDGVLDKMAKIFEMLWKLRSKAPAPKEEKQD
jgi:hypothetical protein